MNSKIVIGDLVINNQVNAVDIMSSFSELTETAVIKLPRYKRITVQGQDYYKIKPGMPVTISLGYDGKFNQEFSGYVASVAPKTPIEIVCENEMWQLKQQQVSHSWRSIKLKDLILFLVPDANVESCFDITLSPYRLDKVSKAQVLEKLKADYGLTIYFRGKTLYAGLAYFENPGTVNYHFQKNVVAGSNNLVFKRKEDVRIKLKAISLLPNNKNITVEVGDSDGEQRTLHFYNITSESELKKQALEKIDQLKYDGFKGSFEGFGMPFVQHSMSAQITNDRYPEQNGTYLIDKVETSYSSSGYRHKMDLGRRSSID